MSKRQDSIDSFDDFFGVTRTDDEKRKSPITLKPTEKAIAALVTNKPIVQLPQTPLTSEERTPSPPKPKPKENETKPTTNGHKARPETAQSTHSNRYESDFDDENGFEEDETRTESSYERKNNSSLPPPKQRSPEIIRRVSDSDLKTSFTVQRKKSKPKQNENIQRKGITLPYIRSNQIRRPKQIKSISGKNETEKRTLSARNDKLKSLESQLLELRRQLDDQRIENSTLRTIQRREEKAIRKYEEKEFDIHKIVRDYTHEIDHMKTVLIDERETKQKLQKQIEVRDEKLRAQKNRLDQVEKIVQEKNLGERHELREKLNQADKKLDEFQKKLENQEKHIENLEKNHRYEVTQELSKQRNLKRQLETNSQKYNDLLTKYEDKARQIETMHIYAQRGGKRPSDSPTNISKSRSLQSLQDSSPRGREKHNDYDKKRREQEKKSKPQRAASNEISTKREQKKIQPKKETLPPAPPPPTKKSSNEQNNHLPPKSKPQERRFSTPKSIDEDEIDDQTSVKTSAKKVSTTIQRSEQHLSQAQIHKRQSGTNSSSDETQQKPSLSIFKLTEPPQALSKPRAKRDLDEKWSDDIFRNNQKDDSAKEDLLAKLIADEQQERRLGATTQPSKNSSMSMFESSTRSTTKQPSVPPPTTTTTVKPSSDPFESLFGKSSNNKPSISRANDFDDIFSTKSSNQPQTGTRNNTYDSLFGPSSTTTTNNNNNISTPYSTQNAKLQRPKLITNPTGSIANRTIFDEVEDFVL